MEQPAMPLRVMVVDDDPDQRQLICDAIQMHYAGQSDTEITALGSAKECLRHDVRNFDAILLDYQLPDMSGLAVLDQIVSQSDTAVIFVTGHNDTTIAAEAILHGAQDYVIKHGDYLFAVPVIMAKAIRQQMVKRENLRLQVELQAMLSELRQRNRQLEQSLEKVNALATTDYMTGLANRRRFSEVLEKCFAEAVRYGHDLSCCMCDLDYYKKLNDKLGHQVGDEVLVLAADVVRSSLRSSDVAARYGGDEIVILLLHTSDDTAMDVCERIRRQFDMEVAKRWKLDCPVTMSIGVASIAANHPTTADQLVTFADRTMYIAKEHGKDQTIMCSQLGQPVVTG